jgi:hypothetical protein
MTVELEPLPGEPDALLSYTDRYSDIAEQLRSASRVLQAIATDEQMIGQAITKVRARVAESGAAILAAEPRYTETSSALAEYAVKLRGAKSDAGDAIRALGSDGVTLERLEGEREDLATRLYNIPMSPEDATQLEKDIHTLDGRIDPMRDSVSGAQRAYDQAVEDRDAAAGAAIARIHEVLGRGADSLLDTIRGAWEDLTDGIAGIADWIWNVALPVVIDAILALEVLSLLLSPLALAVVLWAALGITVLAMLRGEDGDGLLNDFIAAASAILPIVSAGLALLLLREALTPTPRVTQLTPPGGVTSGSKEPHYSSMFDEDVELDKRGGTDSTVVEIVEVVDAQGNSSWRVILPSTQDWEVMNGLLDGKWDPATDQGALNDLGSNLALMLTPSQQAAYQRMVIQAMKDAGIGPNDPVMLSGWSQGGILAGRLASDPNTPGNVQAIVVAGSPIDSMPIPSGVSVLSIQHPGDIVPKADGQPAAPNSYTDARRWATIDGDYSGVDSHNGTKYAASASTGLDASTDPTVRQIVADQAKFFGSDERVNLYQATG